MKECNHCWHRIGEIITRFPSDNLYICCWCGKKKTISTRYDYYDPTNERFWQEEHGRYLPTIYII